MNRPNLLWISILSASFTAHAADCCKESVALVSSLTGQAHVRAAAGETPIANLDWLAAGVTVETGAKSTLTILLANGRRFEFGEHARAIVNADAVVAVSGPLRELPRLPPIPKPAAIASEHGETAGAVRFRGESPPRNLYPAAGAFALPDAARLRFTAVEGAASYRITVRGENREIVVNQPTKAAWLEIPRGLLKPGALYRWQVQAIGPSGVVGEAGAAFVTLSRERLAARGDFLASLSALDPVARLAVLASVDFQLGLFAEAVDEFGAALREHPADPDLQRALAAAKRARGGGQK